MESFSESSSADISTPESQNLEISNTNNTTEEIPSVSKYGDNSEFFEHTKTDSFHQNIQTLLEKPEVFARENDENRTQNPFEEEEENPMEFFNTPLDDFEIKNDTFEDVLTEFEREDHPWFRSDETPFTAEFNQAFESLMQGNPLFSSDFQPDNFEDSFQLFIEEWNAIHNLPPETYSALQESSGIIGKIASGIGKVLSNKQVQKFLVKLVYIVGKYALTGGIIPTNPLELISLVVGDVAETAAIETVEDASIKLTQSVTTALIENVVGDQFDLSSGEAMMVGEIWELLAYGPDEEHRKDCNVVDIRKFVRGDLRAHLRNVKRAG